MPVSVELQPVCTGPITWSGRHNRQEVAYCELLVQDPQMVAPKACSKVHSQISQMVMKQLQGRRGSTCYWSTLLSREVCLPIRLRSLDCSSRCRQRCEILKAFTHGSGRLRPWLRRSQHHVPLLLPKSSACGWDHCLSMLCRERYQV